MRCRYCYEKRGSAEMSFETATQAIRECAWVPNSGIVFFGGEPLLRQDLILEIMKWCDAEWPHNFHYKITTNGLLLSEEFLQDTRNRSLTLAMSFDGLPVAHDAFRFGASGEGTAEALEPQLALLLKHAPYAPIMMVVNPETIGYFSEGVAWLYGKGVRYFIVSLNHAAEWTDRNIAALRSQYRKLEKWILQLYRDRKKIYFSPFDRAIASRVMENYCNSCRFGKRQISVSADGHYYPCVQFVGDSDYELGQVGRGVNAGLQQSLFDRNEAPKPECETCALKARCHNHCACLNRQSTSDFMTVSPVHCAHERVLIPIADHLADTLYRERNGLFLNRYYNPAFPIISYLEDLGG